MYNLIIVDDEDIIRRGLRNTVDWKSLGFQVIGSADNGIAALKLIRSKPPHAVLTDIKMPLMDGLDLLKKISKDFPAIKVVLLSGYDEFAYAKQGMMLGAEGYILKLSLEKDIEEVFSKVRKDLDEQNANKDQLKRLKKERGELVHSNFLNKLLYGAVSRNDVQEFVKEDRAIPLEKGIFCVVCVRLCARLPERWLHEALSFASIKHPDLKFEQFYLTERELVFMYYSNALPEDTVYQLVVKQWMSYKKCLNGRHGVDRGSNISVGIGSGVSHWQTIPTSYMQAREASLIWEVNDTINIHEWNTRAGRKLPDTERLHELVHAIIWGDRNKVSLGLTKIFDSFREGTEAVNVQGFQDLLIELFSVISWRTREMDLGVERIFGSLREKIDVLRNLPNLEELEKWLENILLDITEEIERLRSSHLKKYLSFITRYVVEHYDEKITLEAMSKLVGYSPSHFSVLFKRETGKSFSDYLISFRMEKAKKFIVEGHKVKDVAEMVGYEDCHHFGKMFKKYYSENPTFFKPIE